MWLGSTQCMKQSRKDLSSSTHSKEEGWLVGKESNMLEQSNRKHGKTQPTCKLYFQKKWSNFA